MKSTLRVRRSLLFGAFLVSLSASVSAHISFPVDSAYQDSLRVVVLWNHTVAGSCADMPPVGQQTLDWVIAAIDTTVIRNVKILPSATTTVDSILALWPAKVPHVIIHINAGWGGTPSGIGLPALLTWAGNNSIGMVEIGDDDAAALAGVFTWSTNDASRFQPMSTGLWLNKPEDTLWIRLQPGKDVTIDSTAYPRLTGILRNATGKILMDSTLVFKPAGLPDGRCEADPDYYAIQVGSESKISFLAYQQGYNAAYDSLTPGDPVADTIIGAADYYNTISILQDSTSIGDQTGLRRGISLAFAPQFLKDSVAVTQIVYDAIIYASLVHVGNPPSPVGIRNGKSGKASRFETLQGMKGAVVRVTDIAGRTVLEARADAKGNIRIPSVKLRNGVYVQTVTVAGTISSKSFVVGR